MIELQKPFIDQQFATYNELITVIGDLLANRAPSDNWMRAEKTYRHMHFGRLALVEDEEIHRAKAAFLGELARYRSKGDEEDLISSKLTENSAKRIKAEADYDKELLTKLEPERSAIEEELRIVHAQLNDFHTGLEKASVPLTTALRRSIQRSWTGELGK